MDRIKSMLLGPMLFAITPLALFTGCNKGPKLYDVQGVVMVDGTATEGVNLMFFRSGESVANASGRSGAGGAISTTSNGEKGMELGEYEVAAIYPDPNAKVAEAKFGQSPEDPPDLFKGKYFKQKVKVSVTADAKLNIELSVK
jgi:hypothetical protein